MSVRLISLGASICADLSRLIEVPFVPIPTSELFSSAVTFVLPAVRVSPSCNLKEAPATSDKESASTPSLLKVAVLFLPRFSAKVLPSASLILSAVLFLFATVTGVLSISAANLIEPSFARVLPLEITSLNLTPGSIVTLPFASTVTLYAS